MSTQSSRPVRSSHRGHSVSTPASGTNSSACQVGRLLFACIEPMTPRSVGRQFGQSPPGGGPTAPVRSRPVGRSAVARTWFGATAAVVAVGIVDQLFVTAGLEGTPFPDLRGRLLNVFCYFTVQSNLLVAVTCLLLAVRLDRRSTTFWVLRLTALVAIAVTGIVFHVALKGLQDLQGAAALADFLLHTLSPLMCVLGFLVLGPRERIT